MIRAYHKYNVEERCLGYVRFSSLALEGVFAKQYQEDARFTDVGTGVVLGALTKKQKGKIQHTQLVLTGLQNRRQNIADLKTYCDKLSGKDLRIVLLYLGSDGYVYPEVCDIVLDCISRYMAYDPNDLSTRKFICFFYRNQGLWNEFIDMAKGNYEIAVDRYSEYNINMLQSDYDEARMYESMLAGTLKLSDVPNTFRWNRLMGEFALQHRLHQEAISYYERIRDNRFLSVADRKRIALSYEALHRYDEARSIYLQLLQTPNLSKQAIGNYRLRAFLCKNYLQAFNNESVSGICYFGNRWRLYYNIAEAYFATEQYEKAKTCYVKALQCEDCTYAPIYMRLARCYEALGEYEEEISILDTFIQNYPPSTYTKKADYRKRIATRFLKATRGEKVSLPPIAYDNFPHYMQIYSIYVKGGKYHLAYSTACDILSYYQIASDEEMEEKWACKAAQMSAKVLEMIGNLPVAECVDHEDVEGLQRILEEFSSVDWAYKVVLLKIQADCQLMKKEGLYLHLTSK